MSGTQYMIIGVVVILMATAGLIAAEWGLVRTKKRIKQQVYQIYD